MYKFMLFSVFLFASCSNKEVIISYENGQKNEVYTVNEENQKDGVYKKYREDGSLLEESSYADGILNGTRKLYYDDGEKVEIEEFYKNGTMEGEHFVFYPSGKLMIESNYEDGKMNGLFIKFFESGDTAETVSFVDNEEMGPFTEYHPNGKIQWKGNYLNGDKEFGLLEQFDDQGTLIKKMMCDTLGVCQTIWTPEKGDIVPKKLNLSKS